MPQSSSHDQRLGHTTGQPQFTTTHWSVVLEAARPGSPGSVDAFAQLYSDYWYPLYAYVRRRGRSPQEAEDLTQDFFISLFEQERLCGLERDGGRFRSFLLKALQNFLANDWDRVSARKRGGGCCFLSLDEIDAEARYLEDCCDEAPEGRFDRDWAFAVIEHALLNLETQMRAARKEQLFQQLRPHLQGDRNGRPYAEIAAGLGMSEGALKVAVHRLRQQYVQLVRAEVARTVGNDADIDDEWRHLIRVVTSSR
jgi:RNA polymerase sigma factor (sigma-70 family)